jgi:galactokinase
MEKIKRATNYNPLPAEEHDRASRLNGYFFARHRRGTDFIVRAPGRVNLIGEHTDYNGFPVLPVTLRRSVLIAGASLGNPEIILKNLDERFPPHRFPIDPQLPPGPAGDWSNYVRAAVVGVLRIRPLIAGARLLVDGNIPWGAGLASSSALVVASALALIAAQRGDWNAERLAEEMAVAERFVGTLSGGMDQAICLLGREGHALRIDFFPLRTRPVKLPEGYSLVVCHSLVPARKAAGAREAYNRRVAECSVATLVLQEVLGLQTAPIYRVADLFRYRPESTPSELIEALSTVIPREPVSISDLARRLGVSKADVKPLGHFEIGPDEPLKPVARLRHVLSEAERVELAELALAAGDIRRAGELMEESHASCRDNYEISCPALEELVQVAKAAGAIGPRLTGAGFGGCTVQFVADDYVPDFIEQMDRGFYRKHLTASSTLAHYRFAFKPGPAAVVAYV